MNAKKTLCSLLIASTIALTSVPVPSTFAEPEPAAVKQMIDDYNQRLAAIQQLSDQEDQLQGQLSTINRQIFEYDQLEKELQPDIDAVTQQIQSTQTEIDNKKNSMDERNLLVKNRLVSMYTEEAASVSFLEVLLGSANFGDFINRLGMLTMIFRQDKQMIDTLAEDKQSLTTMKEELDSQQKALLDKMSMLNQAKADQEDKVQERMNLLSQLQQEKRSEVDATQQEAENLAAIDEELTPDVQAALKEALQKNIVSEGNWDWPVPDSHTITSDFGARGQEFHAGIDIGAPLGTSIVAVDSGIVLYAGKATGFGNWIVIKHANGLMSVYGHMYGDGIFVKVGQEVQRGQLIAVVGSDGQSTGPHLHFAVATGITGNKMDYIDPRPYLNNEHL
ncbi:murein hydrolase activator EnvC family protein [Paenibacillus hexagrammi]|uniref:Peptidoglycan DD-metalloendopeptidase family protein n=1 Tax=Paenibacillus hexagrammi TaxID=2908839 RepID=A0ABY3SQC5_9BACL|nr:M23 family metallopeptidase [Paenibacillus sp. YPD9-1]UJF35750.1 peptidoglycan DD-metalloendopeptidase family protein [Paenibacillus sp. YPD9-1]